MPRGCPVWARSFLSASLCAALWWAGANGRAERGSRLFSGKEALSGRIRGHGETLPPEAVRCVNCHGADANAGLGRAAAPRIDEAWLVEFHQRRGGPPSRYDEATFCKLLRTGVDPAQILVSRTMPTYELDEEQCGSLWHFLTVQEAASGKSENMGSQNEKQ